MPGLLASLKCRAGKAKNLSKIAFILAGDSLNDLIWIEVTSDSRRCLQKFCRVSPAVCWGRKEREREEIRKLV